MTNNEIIKFLQSKQIPQCGDKEYTTDEEYEAYQRAIDALEQQPITTANNDEPITVIYPTIVCDNAIRRDAVKKWICKTCPDDSECQRDCNVIKGIDALPPVTPKQKYGKWILLDERANSGYYCSNCQKKLVKEGWSNTVKKIKYCPNCGARMVEPQEREET